MSGSDLVVQWEETEESGYVTAEVFLTPLPGNEPMRVKARIGSLVRDILPECARAPMVCVIDGVPLKREWWMQRPVCEGDRIQFVPVYLGGGGNSRSILAVVAAIVVTYFAPYAAGSIAGAMGYGTGSWAYYAIEAGIILAGNALISAVIMPNVNGGALGDADKASSVYSVDTQGNAARVFSPIPVQYGRMKYYPNYASQPYTVYHTTPWEIEGTSITVPYHLKSSSAASHSDGMQYYYALFCLGQGEYEIDPDNDIYIGDAKLSAFEDVLVRNILPPGQLPQYVNPCVVTSEAVSGQSLDDGTWVGLQTGFPVCGPGRTSGHIALDFVFPQGLCKLNDQGKAKSATVAINIQCCLLDDAGNAKSNWFNVWNSSFTGSTLTPQRRTVHIRGVSGRWAVRVQRSGKKDSEDTKDMTSCQWTALRAYLDEPAPLCKTATHFELVMRASEQLSSLSQRKISIISTRKVPTWDSTTPIATRSPAHALWDKWTNTVYGDGIPADRIDVEMLKHYHEVAMSRGDYFDYVFENRSSSQEGDQTIAKVMRCVALQRQGVKTIVRDELCEMPLTLFNPTNIAEKSVSLEYIQITEETTDGVIAEYFSNVSWDWEEVECPGPGRTYSNPGNKYYNPALPVMENPIRITMNGITTRKHAEREGLYYAYSNALRRQFANWTTELQGALVYYGAPVLLSTTLYNMQQGGEVRDWNIDTMEMQLTNEVRNGKIVLMKNDGTLTDPIGFTIIDEATNTIRLHSEPGALINYGDYASERTKYVILEGEMIRRIVKILSISPKGIAQTGAPSYELRGVVDVPEIHTIDNFLLVPDDEDDTPITPIGPDDPVPTVPTEQSMVITLKDVDLLTWEALYPNTGYPATMAFYPDGAVRGLYYARGANNPVIVGGVAGAETTWNHWVEGAPIQNVGSLYEIMFIGHWARGTIFEPVYLSPLGSLAAPSEEYLNNPERSYMRGYKLHYVANVYPVTVSGMEQSTAQALKYADGVFYLPDAEAVGTSTNQMVYTDWIPLDSQVELKGWYDTTPHPYAKNATPYLVYPSMPGDNWKYFCAVIRDKATHTFQDGARYRLGFHRDYDNVG